MEYYPQKITCPECKKVCNAVMKVEYFWPTYIHECEHCKYIIMESEWQLVSDPNQVPDL